MKVAYELETGEVKTWAGSPVSAISVKRRDRIQFPTRFTEDGTVVELPTGVTGKLAVRQEGVFSGSLIALASTWSVQGTGPSRYYIFDLNFNTDAAGLGRRVLCPSLDAVTP